MDRIQQNHDDSATYYIADGMNNISNREMVKMHMNAQHPPPPPAVESLPLSVKSAPKILSRKLGMILDIQDTANFSNFSKYKFFSR